ncbi:MAG TPA: ATP-binding protein [Candidatus Polarisedimenticolaceae bacterium]|nr:ATP-binding protein [Candidatus Polarisedimenticolaceae bacterium]
MSAAKSKQPRSNDAAAPSRFSHRAYSIRLRTSLPSTKPALNRGVRAVLKIARACGWVPDQLTDLEIALREALANAIIHGNSLQRGKRVFLRCYARPRRSLMIVVRDEGDGFNPTGVPDPRDDHRLHLPSGRGLLLMRELMDHVEYRRGGREVLLVAHRPAASES